ncbi:hypothetical protein [Parachryseolinea silvisoli]|uniref:hypothetical protein n=1 Tax=Parachryseolinea silvisoli TaxID=2873601 RepID=UPI002265F5BE|nr:hypothetical protein [Parachryseolinea silvisoli]MCD9014399.1 hypothetical protein [Parachryseolinea silvisoli]
MRQNFTILFLLYFSASFGQGTDKAFIDRWLKLCDENIPVDSVRAYYIDGEYYTDTAKINAYLQTIPPGRIKSIWYSKIMIDNYVPGRGSIYVMTVKKMDSKDVEAWMKDARNLYVDKYTSYSQHILTDSRDPVLLIDGQAVSAAIAKATLDRIDPKEIYGVSVNGFFPVPTSLFGQNAKNGLVQIWTKQRYNKNNKTIRK